jgi:hypothetical protein
MGLLLQLRHEAVNVFLQDLLHVGIEIHALLGGSLAISASASWLIENFSMPVCSSKSMNTPPCSSTSALRRSYSSRLISRPSMVVMRLPLDPRRLVMRFRLMPQPANRLAVGTYPRRRFLLTAKIDLFPALPCSGGEFERSEPCPPLPPGTCAGAGYGFETCGSAPPRSAFCTAPAVTVVLLLNKLRNTDMEIAIEIHPVITSVITTGLIFLLGTMSP